MSRVAFSIAKEIGRDFEFVSQSYDTSNRPSVSELLRMHKWAIGCKLINPEMSLYNIQMMTFERKFLNRSIITKFPPRKIRIETETLCGYITKQDETYLTVRYTDPEWPNWWCEIMVNKKNKYLSTITALNLPEGRVFCKEVSEDKINSRICLLFRNIDENRTPEFYVNFEYPTHL